MSVWDKIRDGEYKSQLPYPSTPKRPEILNKRAGQLTSDELASLKGESAMYQATKEAADKMREAYRVDERRLHEQFVTDLCAEYGVDQESEFGRRMFEQAWQRGHSGGHNDVASVFDDLVPLWNLYQAAAKAGAQ